MATGNNTLHVEVVTADSELYNGEADIVDAPGADGQLGILPEHTALLTLLAPGLLRIKLGGAEEDIFVSGGFLEVSNNHVTVLADEAEHADSIDQARAEASRRRAEELLNETHDQRERAELQAQLTRAVNRLKVTGMVRQGNRRRIKPQRDDNNNQ